MGAHDNSYVRHLGHALVYKCGPSDYCADDDVGVGECWTAFASWGGVYVPASGGPVCKLGPPLPLCACDFNDDGGVGLDDLSTAMTLSFSDPSFSLSDLSTCMDEARAVRACQ